jgi:septal ring factor EnvC (AmiA/AmiB activator)
LKKLRGETMKETSDYRARLTALRAEQARLERKQAELLSKRRAEIGKLVERLDLLEADDDALAGALLELKNALAKTGDERLARWRAAGAAFRRRDKDPKAAAPRTGNGVAQSNPDATRS